MTFETMPNSNLENFIEKSAKGLAFGVFFQEKKFCSRTNRNVGKRGQNLVRNTFFKSKLKLSSCTRDIEGNLRIFVLYKPTKRCLSLMPSALS